MIIKQEKKYHTSTQIMATPVLKEEEAKKVIEDSKRVASDKSINGAKKLAEQFKNMIQ